MVASESRSPQLEHRGYNRGLILGFTMAESLLLLVFCLLLVAAALISSERNQKLALERQLAVAKDQIAELAKDKQLDEARIQELQSRLSQTMSPDERQEVENEWRELVAAQDTIRQLKDNGLETKDLATLAKVQALLRDHGIALQNAPAEIERLLALNVQATKPHDWPPIINLSEAGGYFFKSGSAELTTQFEQKLNGSIADEISKNLARYQVDVIEVIGHTDEQPISRTTSNLDKTYLDVLGAKLPITAMQPADNAGLGLARAIAVADILKVNPKLGAATVLPMSAAQLILPGDTVTVGQSGNVESRRRIEIRIRRRAQTLNP